MYSKYHINTVVEDLKLSTIIMVLRRTNTAIQLKYTIIPVYTKILQEYNTRYYIVTNNTEVQYYGIGYYIR